MELGEREREREREREHDFRQGRKGEEWTEWESVVDMCGVM